jgi:hypothetical protein
MNASATRAMVGNTTSTTEFDSLTLAEYGIVLKYEKKESRRNILFGTGQDLYQGLQVKTHLWLFVGFVSNAVCISLF